MSKPSGAAFYDDPARLRAYQEHRAGALNPNRAMEEPAVQRAVGDVTGLRVLDAACGDGAHALELLDAGAAHVTAFDGSTAMVDRTRALLAGCDAQVLDSDLETFEAGESAFDLVLARLCLHYVADAEHVLQRLQAEQQDGARGELALLLDAPQQDDHQVKPVMRVWVARQLVHTLLVRDSGEVVTLACVLPAAGWTARAVCVALTLLLAPQIVALAVALVVAAPAEVIARGERLSQDVEGLV